ncbi:MAG: DUF1003 domain-containing protein [Rhodoferax sp.]|uniref:DUF1003 domain-containing protein n=1 Tax=Rhodoferax sp. TaxID=50421 RepID=UPI003266F950
MTTPDRTTEKLLDLAYEAMDAQTQKVASYIAKHKHIARNTASDLDDDTAFGARAADAVASFGGSWTFILLFMAVLVVWVVLNVVLLARWNAVFDPYPFILLNLFLSMLAAVQAPIILMSQNRQATKDRLHAEHDYEVNLKAELEIMLLHEKIDALRQGQWAELLEIQKEQLQLLAHLKDKATG